MKKNVWMVIGLFGVSALSSEQTSLEEKDDIGSSKKIIPKDEMTFNGTENATALEKSQRMSFMEENDRALCGTVEIAQNIPPDLSKGRKILDDQDPKKIDTGLFGEILVEQLGDNDIAKYLENTGFSEDVQLCAPPGHQSTLDLDHTHSSYVYSPDDHKAAVEMRDDLKGDKRSLFCCCSKKKKKHTPEIRESQF